MKQNHYMKGKKKCKVCQHPFNEHYVGYGKNEIVYTCHHENGTAMNGFAIICCGCNLERVPSR